MFTKTTIVLLGLFVACEVCTLIVFCYQRTVRKLATRLKVVQSALAFCYPRWMLAMYWGSFAKYGIILALFLLDWRCGLISLGVFVLFFGLSIIIPVPDGRNLIWIRREVKRRGSRTIGVGIYQFLVSEIEHGIVATGGDLEKLDEEAHENLEWNTKTSVARAFCKKTTSVILNDSMRHDDSISSPSNDLGKSGSQTSSPPKADEERTLRNAPICIKCALALIGSVIVGGLLIVVWSLFTSNEISSDLMWMFCMSSCVLLCLFCWAYHILKGKNWTRVFSTVIAFLILFNPGLCYIGSVGFALVVTALLFCPGANKWFVSWPRGWSYWPVLLLVVQIVTVVLTIDSAPRLQKNISVMPDVELDAKLGRRKDGVEERRKPQVVSNGDGYDSLFADEAHPVGRELAQVAYGDRYVGRATAPMRSGQNASPQAREGPFADYTDEELERIVNGEKRLATYNRKEVKPDTKMRLAELEMQLKGFEKETGRFPSSLKELQVMYGAGRVRFLRDEWETEIYYETNGKDFGLSSAGPDKKWETADDITIIHRTAP